MHEGDTWFGSPPIKLPVRQKFDAGGSNWTYEAPAWKKFVRAVLRGGHDFDADHAVHHLRHLGRAVVRPKRARRRLSVSCWSSSPSRPSPSRTALTSVVIILKWLTMGRYEPMVRPMWSWWAMRTEAVAVIYWGMAGKVLLDHLRGTPFLPWMMRLFGCKFGKGVLYGHDRHHRIRLHQSRRFRRPQRPLRRCRRIFTKTA